MTSDAIHNANLRPAETQPDPRRRLAEIAAQQRELADEAAKILATMGGDAPYTPAGVYYAKAQPHVRAADLLDSARAEKISGVSRSTLIRAARRDPALGWRTPGGSWRFVRRELLSRFNSPRDGFAEIAEFADAQCLFEMTNHD